MAVPIHSPSSVLFLDCNTNTPPMRAGGLFSPLGQNFGTPWTRTAQLRPPDIHTEVFRSNMSSTGLSLNKLHGIPQLTHKNYSSLKFLGWRDHMEWGHPRSRQCFQSPAVCAIPTSTVWCMVRKHSDDFSSALSHSIGPSAGNIQMGVYL